MEIYVLVEVSYDYYRFQTNLYAHICKEKIIEYFNGMNKKTWFRGALLEYEEKSNQNKKLDEKERCHYWLQEFKISKDDVFESLDCPYCDYGKFNSCQCNNDE